MIEALAGTQRNLLDLFFSLLDIDRCCALLSAHLKFLVLTSGGMGNDKMVTAAQL